LPWSTRVAAVLCVGALTSTTVGVVVAAGISAYYGWRGIVFDGIALGLPALLAIDTIRRDRRPAPSDVGAVVEGRLTSG
jgi:hypothetical protein